MSSILIPRLNSDSVSPKMFFGSSQEGNMRKFLSDVFDFYMPTPHVPYLGSAGQTPITVCFVMQMIYKSPICVRPFVIYITNYDYNTTFINPPLVFFFLIGIHSTNPLAPST